jgi:hypothetical protein
MLMCLHRAKGIAVTSDRLSEEAGILAGDDGEGRRVRVQIYHIRSVLGHDSIETTREAYPRGPTRYLLTAKGRAVVDGKRPIEAVR